jgi:hypothetical protein
MSEHYLVIGGYGNYDAVKIVTSYVPTDNAVRELDWMAFDLNWQSGDAIGHGASEQEAINHLREELESRVHPSAWELEEGWNASTRLPIWPS